MSLIEGCPNPPEPPKTKPSPEPAEFPGEAAFLDEARWDIPISVWVPGVNDKSAVLVKGLTLTRYELGVVALHLQDKLLDNRVEERSSRTTTTHARIFNEFATRRLDTFARHLGEKYLRELLEPLRSAHADFFRMAADSPSYEPKRLDELDRDDPIRDKVNIPFGATVYFGY